MSKQVPWNNIILEEFAALAGLNDIDYEIMRTRMLEWTITKQAEHLHMSSSSISRRIARLKKRYDDVQPLSEHLPPRKWSAKEAYMDSH